MNREIKKEDKIYKNIFVPLDGSELAECVLPHAESIAKRCGVESIFFVRVIELVHIVAKVIFSALRIGSAWNQRLGLRLNTISIGW